MLKLTLIVQKEIELETRHDVVAFTRQVSETLGEEEEENGFTMVLLQQML